MLLVKNYLDKSSIHGMWVFAWDYIPKWTIVWKYIKDFDAIIPANKLSSFPEIAQKWIEHYWYLENGNYILCMDDAKFFNHSKNYNVDDKWWSETTIANRNIKKWEEILCNYESFDEIAMKKLG